MIDEPITFTSDIGFAVVSDSNFTSIRVPEARRWEPQADITAYELALAIPQMLVLMTGNYGYPQDLVDGLPPEVRRHFSHHDGSAIA